jgi:hypothetical protein
LPNGIKPRHGAALCVAGRPAILIMVYKFGEEASEAAALELNIDHAPANQEP